MAGQRRDIGGVAGQRAPAAAPPQTRERGSTHRHDGCPATLGDDRKQMQACSVEVFDWQLCTISRRAETDSCDNPFGRVCIYLQRPDRILSRVYFSVPLVGQPCLSRKHLRLCGRRNIYAWCQREPGYVPLADAPQGRAAACGRADLEIREGTNQRPARWGSCRHAAPPRRPPAPAGWSSRVGSAPRDAPPPLKRRAWGGA